jgi:hypothetical protein
MTYKTRHLDNPYILKWVTFSTLNTDSTPQKRNEPNVAPLSRPKGESVSLENNSNPDDSRDSTKNETNPNFKICENLRNLWFQSFCTNEPARWASRRSPIGSGRRRTEKQNEPNFPFFNRKFIPKDRKLQNEPNLNIFLICHMGIHNKT